jgi:hypothetical protein
MKNFLLDILRQATGGSFRKGKLSVGYWANKKRMELGLDENTLEDVFRTGRKVESFVKSYGPYSVSVSYKWDERHKQYVITNCSRYENKF